jgi:hypothetical protein
VAQYNIAIPDHLVGGLNRLVARYNADTGRDHSVSEWLRLHVLELAMQDELAAERERLALQAQRDVNAALIALRDRLAGEGVTA